MQQGVAGVDRAAVLRGVAAEGRAGDRGRAGRGWRTALTLAVAVIDRPALRLDEIAEFAVHGREVIAGDRIASERRPAHRQGSAAKVVTAVDRPARGHRVIAVKRGGTHRQRHAPRDRVNISIEVAGNPSAGQQRAFSPVLLQENGNAAATRPVKPPGQSQGLQAPPPVRHMSVHSRTLRPPAGLSGTWRDNAKNGPRAGKPQPTGRLCRWWQVLGSNQRRLSRRFYRPAVSISR
jgi:hypothetical protein